MEKKYYILDYRAWGHISGTSNREVIKVGDKRYYRVSETEALSFRPGLKKKHYRDTSDDSEVTLIY